MPELFRWHHSLPDMPKVSPGIRVGVAHQRFCGPTEDFRMLVSQARDAPFVLSAPLSA